MLVNVLSISCHPFLLLFSSLFCHQKLQFIIIGELARKEPHGQIVNMSELADTPSEARTTATSTTKLREHASITSTTFFMSLPILRSPSLTEGNRSDSVTDSPSLIFLFIFLPFLQFTGCNGAQSYTKSQSRNFPEPSKYFTTSRLITC